MPNITDALVSLVALYNSTQSSSALACCKDPIVADIELLVNLAMTIKENLFLQSYPISYNFIVGLNANFLQLQFNWTQWWLIFFYFNFFQILLIFNFF